jgi:hypothetical protein
MTDETNAPQLKIVSDDAPAAPIAKPAAFDVDKFKSETPDTIANVETLLTALPHYSIAQAKDFVRLHPDEDNYWSRSFASSACRSRVRARTVSISSSKSWR